MKTNPNDYIHSTLEKTGDITLSEGGLTKREYFAAMAMQGLLSVPLSEYEYIDGPIVLSVNFADDLIDALNGAADD